MSLLHQETPEEIDDAARGEEFTKGSSHIVWASVIAAIVVTAVLVVFYLANRTPPAATAEIVQVWAHPVHGETSGFDANGQPMPKQTIDQVLVFARVRFHNQSKNSLVFQDLRANILPVDGIPLSVSAGSPAQFDEVFLAYPELAALHSEAFRAHNTIAPGQSVEGIAFWVIQNKQQWESRKDWGPNPNNSDPGSKSGLNFTFSIQYQPRLVLAPSAEITAL